MAAGADTAVLHLLGWRDNGDGLDVALAANRLLAGGARAWSLREPCAPARAGDYLVALDAPRQRALAGLGVRTSAWNGELPRGALALARPAACLFAGTASKFPYYAYYALALLRLGVAYVPCDGGALAAGALDGANLLVLPGGFATWGIDAAEGAPGADARVRDFLDRGGTAIGSCGGAFYLSAGRPGWTGTAQAKPLYTHEYLQSGVGIVDIEMRDGPLAFGCPPTVDVPYFHGPIYDVLGSGIGVAATFRALTLPGRLAIDNPLDGERFRHDMAGKPAILVADGDRGRAVLFSPHPEMGDLVRKYIALDGYVRRYLPIRGMATMRDTLRHYRVVDAPCFRLISNAVHALMADERTRQAAPARSGEARERDLGALCDHALARLPGFDAGDDGDLLREVASGIAARLDAARPRFDAAASRARSGDLEPALTHLVATMEAHFASAQYASHAQRLMELDLAVALLECWTRAAEFDLAIAR